jgi:hypothetical protein
MQRSARLWIMVTTDRTRSLAAIKGRGCEWQAKRAATSEDKKLANAAEVPVLQAPMARPSCGYRH